MLITNENKPKVRIFIGSVSKCKTGFKNVFNIPSTIATVKAAKTPSICTSVIT